MRIDYQQYRDRCGMGPRLMIATAEDVFLLPEHFNQKGALVLRCLYYTAPVMHSSLLLITGAADGKHGENSLHWQGLGWDFRYLGWREGAILTGIVNPNEDAEVNLMHGEQRRLAREWAARAARWSDFKVQVIVEANHIHGEYDVKGAR